MQKLFNLKKKTSSTIFGVIAAAMCMTMFGISQNGGGSQITAARVNSDDITAQELYNAIQNKTSQLRQQLGDNYEQFKGNLNIPQMALEELTANKINAQFIQRYGLTSTTEQIKNELAAIPAFEGKVTKEKYNNFIRNIGLTESALQDVLSQQASMKQFDNLLSDLGTPTTLELRNGFRKENSKIKVSYVTFTQADFVNKVEVSDEEIQKYYEDHKDNYRSNKKVSYNVVQFPATEYVEAVDLTDDENTLAEEEKN